jgi:hypothetical protein
VEALWCRPKCGPTGTHHSLQVSTLQQDGLTRDSLLKRGSDFFVELRQKHLDDKVLEDAAKRTSLVLKGGRDNRAGSLDESQCGLKQGGNVERIGRYEGPMTG